MAFILKYSRLVFRLVRITLPANLDNALEGVSIFQWKNVPAVNAIFKKSHSMNIKMVAAKSLDRSINQLGLDARFTHQVFKKDIDEILEAIGKYNSINYHQTLSLLRCCTNLSMMEKPEEKVKLTEKMWSLFKKLDLKFDILHYNLLLEVYVQNEHNFSSEEFLKNLKEENIEPNLITYQKLLKAYCQRGDLAGANKLLQNMKAQDLPINEDIFNSLICGYCQLNDLESAEGILNLMKQKEVNPSSESYIHLLCACAKKGDIEEVKKLLDYCENSDIVLMDKHLLEVIYTLAVNGHEVHIEEILGRINKSCGYNFYAIAMIHRLLNKNLDDIAKKIFETLVLTNIEMDTRKYGSSIIDHIIRDRSAEELLNLCDYVEKKELILNPISYALRQTFLEGNVEKSLNLISAMEKRNLPVRPHYFWPVLIQASKHANEGILDVLHKMKMMKVTPCLTTVTKIILPRYDFKANWKFELERLKKAGVNIYWITGELLLNFLSNKNFADAYLMAHTRPVHTSHLNIRDKLINELAEGNLDAGAFVSIINCLLHDIYSKPVKTPSSKEEINMEAETETEAEEREAKLKKGFCDFKEFQNCTVVQLAKVCPENVTVEVLQKMLHKNLAITREAGLEILKDNSSPEVKELVEKLSSPVLEFMWNRNLLKVKDIRKAQHRRALLQASLNGDIGQAENTWIALGDNALVTDYLRMMILLVKSNKKEKALEMVNELREKIKVSVLSSEDKKMFSVLLNLIGDDGDVENTEKMFSFGLEFNLVQEKIYSLLINPLIKRGDLEKAVDVFCKKCTKWNYVSGFKLLSAEIIEQRNEKLLQKFTNTIVKVKGEEVCASMLLAQLAQKGLVKQIKKILETPDLKVSNTILYDYISKFFRKKNTLCFETLIEASRESSQINRGNLYVWLMESYIKAKKTNLIKELLTRMKLDDPQIAIDPYMAKKLVEYFQDVGEEVPPYVTSFEKIKFQEDKIKSDDFESKINASDKNEVMDNNSKSQNELAPMEEMPNISNLVRFQPVDEVVQYAEKCADKQVVKEISVNYLKMGKPTEYVEFIDKMSRTNPELISNCFHFPWIVEKLKEDENLLDKIQAGLLTCSKPKSLKKALLSIWLVNLSLPHRYQEAEKMFNECIKPLITGKRLERSLFQLMRKKKSPAPIDSVLANEVLKSKIAAAVPVLYSFIISHYVVTGNLDTALEYVKKAVEENHGKFLNKKHLHSLSELLKKQNKSFPYQDLLIEESTTNGAIE